MFGVDNRTTLDLDTTLKGISLTKENIEKIIDEIINIDVDDNIEFSIFSIKDIRLEEKYSGFCVHLNANFEGLKKHLLIDITTGDVITYREINFSYKTIFDDEIINIMAYNVETIIAEKFEAVISRNIVNSRMKDYYDLYMFVTLKWDSINKKILVKAIKNTCTNRGSTEFLNNSSYYIGLISKNENFKDLWIDYQSKNEYAKNISFEGTIKAIEKINKVVKESV